MPHELTRRRFLSLSTAAAATSLLPRHSLAAEPWPLRLSTSSIHYSKLPIEQTCQRISALGFQAIDIWSAYTGCPHLDDVLTRLGPDGLKDLLAKHNLKLFAFSVYVGGYRKYAELLGKSGGGLAIQGASAPVKPAELKTRMKTFLDSLKPDLELAEKHNSFLAIENHGSSLLDSPDSFKAFTDLNTHPRLGIALAPYHLQAIKAPVEQVIAICGKQLLFFYAWQLADATNQLPGIGPTDFTPWLSALAKINYAGYVNPFMHGELPPDPMSAALTQSRDYLKTTHAKTM
ncbi:MAG: sugar phosphate isomerase/epimerase [Planctomycetota bacterium]|nr:sugar phosphate isomerase/epimerase [Planctomycetota bacterium]